MKKLPVVLTLILILSLALTACSRQPTPTTAVTTTEVATESATTEEVATEVVTSAPAATEGAAPAAQDKWCSGTKIVFFPGGSPGGGFETVVYNGALAAAADTGADVEYVWSDWDPAKMTNQFTQAVATNPDGIAIMGHPGDAAFDPLIDDAESKGILVTSMNTQLPEAQGQIQLQRFRLRRRHSLRRWIRPGPGSREAVRRAVGRQGLPVGSVGTSGPR